ncbi:MAG: sulfurtransferase complex subunit TusD [Rhodobacteraceae bacterium]|nr:sulfurtransferase complex subunit TusD [Paracoccaceae bacterium]
MNLKIGVIVSVGPYTHQAADTAYHFVKAALRKGYDVPRVFFYHDGVAVSNRLQVPPQDERNVQRNWTALAQDAGIDLVVCVAAAQRRGVLDAKEAARLGKDSDTLAEGFRISGLGQMIEMAIQCDRIVTFGD